jgi:Clr5 domain/Fungal Zn(2)-Cys(6) binuclear cluster domain
MYLDEHVRRSHSTEELSKPIQSLLPTLSQGSVRETGVTCDRCRQLKFRCTRIYISGEACDSCLEASALCVHNPRPLNARHVFDQGVGTGSSQADKSNESLSHLRKAEHLLKVTSSLKDSNTPLPSLHPPLQLNAAPPSTSMSEYEHESTSEIPSLAKSVQSAAEANLGSPPLSVPKLQSQSTSTDAPNAIQSLPSLHKALRQTADTPIVKTPNSASLFPHVPGQPAIVGQQNSASPSSVNQEAAYICTFPNCPSSGQLDFNSQADLLHHYMESHQEDFDQHPTPRIQPRSTPGFIEQHLLERDECQDHYAGLNSETAPKILTRSGVQYTPELWAEKKDIITQLYSKEGKSLREVKEYLRERHDFRPTCVRSCFLIKTFTLTMVYSDRMYQRKIAQWGLEKKTKRTEMSAILRIVKEREAAGQESIFRIRGRRFDIEEVYRYFKRRGEDPNKLDVQDSPIPSTITVETPRRSDITINDAAEFLF